MALEGSLPHPGSYQERSYRKAAQSSEVSFAVKVEESDLWISAGGLKTKNVLKTLAYERLLHYRVQLTGFLQRYPGWGASLVPVKSSAYSVVPPLADAMMKASGQAGVGPMAAVAGAFAEFVGRDLSVAAAEVVVENGGDIFLTGRSEYRLAIFAGSSPLSGRLGIRLKNSHPFSCGVCTSSGRVGHSLSFGRADAVTIVSGNTALADAVATAMANQVKKKSDLAAVVEKALVIDGILGAVAILDDDLAAGGQIELIDL